MAEENKQINEVKKEEHKHEAKPESKMEKVETKEEKKSDKKEAKKPVVKKDEAVARGTNLKASKKHCMYICSFIKNKPVDLAISQLQEVILMKRLIPFKGEIPHKHQPGLMAGRYPIAASKEMIYLLKSLKGNILANGLDMDKTRIYLASATWASRPAKKGGARFKRTFVLLKAKEIMEAKK